MSARTSTGPSSGDPIDAVLDLIDRTLAECDVTVVRDTTAERFAALLDEHGLR